MVHVVVRAWQVIRWFWFTPRPKAEPKPLGPPPTGTRGIPHRFEATSPDRPTSGGYLSRKLASEITKQQSEIEKLKRERDDIEHVLQQDIDTRKQWVERRRAGWRDARSVRSDGSVRRYQIPPPGPPNPILRTGDAEHAREWIDATVRNHLGSLISPSMSPRTRVALRRLEAKRKRLERGE